MENTRNGRPDRERHPPLPVEVADALGLARRRLGFSYRALARRAGLSAGMIRAVEHRDRCPSVAYAEALAEALHLDYATTRALLAHAAPGVGRSSPYSTRSTAP